MMRSMMIFGAVIVLMPSLSFADVPALMSFQGILKDAEGQPVEDDVYAIQFKIYNAETEGDVLWESNGFIPIQTTDGLFQHVLGSTNPLPDSLSRYNDLWVGITVDLDEELVPRTRLVSVPFSIASQYSDTTGTSLDKTIDASELITGTVDTARFSAYEDLVSEGKIGESPDQVAAGNHMHTGGLFSGTMVRVEDTTYIVQTLPYASPLKTIDIPAGQVNDYFRIMFPVECIYGNGSVRIDIILNGQYISPPLSYWVSGKDVCIIDGLKLTDGRWFIATGYFGSTGSGSRYFDELDISPESGFTVSLWGWTDGGSTTIKLRNLMVEYDVD